MSKFDELEGRMFGAPIFTLPYDAHTSESAWLLVNLNRRGHFPIILINMAGLFLIINLSWPLRRLKPMVPI